VESLVAAIDGNSKPAEDDRRDSAPYSNFRVGYGTALKVTAPGETPIQYTAETLKHTNDQTNTLDDGQTVGESMREFPHD
jgi:hypothetical protein